VGFSPLNVGLTKGREEWGVMRAREICKIRLFCTTIQAHVPLSLRHSGTDETGAITTLSHYTHYTHYIESNVKKGGRRIAAYIPPYAVYKSLEHVFIVG